MNKVVRKLETIRSYEGWRSLYLSFATWNNWSPLSSLHDNIWYCAPRWAPNCYT